MGLLDFFSREAGQARRAALDSALKDAASYYLGPTGMDARLGLLGMMNPITDLESAGQNAQRVGRGEMDALVPMITDMATVAAPAIGARVVGGPAVNAMTDSLLGIGGPTREAATDYAKRFAADESGAIKLWHGSPHDFDRFSMDKIGTGSSDAIDGRGIYLTDDIAEASSYKRPDLRANPFATKDKQSFSGDGVLYEVGVNAAPADFVPTRVPVSNLPNDLQSAVRKRFRENDEFADQRDLSFYLAKDPSLQNEIAELGYRGFKADRYGNENYVVFDDRLINVLGKDGDRYTPEGKAQTVLDMLADGRAGEVTDEMLDLGDPTLNARLNEYLFNNYDLPMDEASRMARAREMGFDTDAPLYHGGNPDILGLDQSEYGVWGSGVYTARNPDGAAKYAVGGSTYPLSARTTTSATEKDFSEELAKIYKDKGFIGYGPQSKATTEALTARGYGSIADDDVVNTFDPRNIRSRFARFDPRLAHLRNLSAGVGGLGLLGSGLMTAEDERAINNYINGGLIGGM